MRKTIAIFILLLTFTMANSKNQIDISEKTAPKVFLQQQSLLETIRVVPKSRETRVTREVNKNEQCRVRTMRENRKERLAQRLTRDNRNVRYVKIKERKYLAKLK